MTRGELMRAITYDPKTGHFHWKVVSHLRPDMIGVRAGCPSSTGHRLISVNRKKYCEHRLAWLFMTGAWPERYIDHINGDPADNRWCNLREADHFQNIQNSKLSKRNSSGFKGVWWDARRHKWTAQIMARRRQKYLGQFDTPEEAHAAYQAAAIRLHGEFARMH
jgi:hypothetical protein